MSIDIFANKCSICFDRHYDFFFDRCKDQFCIQCFDRYVKEIVGQSWGLTNANVKCPACSDPINYMEWKKYVEKDTLDKYAQFTKAYAAFSRYCRNCATQVFAVKTPTITDDPQEHDFENIVNRIRNLNMFQESAIRNIQAEIESFLFHNTGNVKQIYAEFLKSVKDLKDGKTIDEEQEVGPSTRRRKSLRQGGSKSKPTNYDLWQISLISSDLIALERNPNEWKALQFLHIANLPQAQCHKCLKPICLKCGEGSWHRGLTCQQYLERKIIDQKGNSNSIANLKWKLKNSKVCPNCCIFITRDEGCNKILCSSCSYAFCWICSGPWSEKCGFYKCATEPSYTTAPTSFSIGTSSEDDIAPRNVIDPTVGAKTELGVPDVSSIMSRLQTSTNDSDLMSDA